MFLWHTKQVSLARKTDLAWLQLKLCVHTLFSFLLVPVIQSTLKLYYIPGPSSTWTAARKNWKPLCRCAGSSKTSRRDIYSFLLISILTWYHTLLKTILQFPLSAIQHILRILVHKTQVSKETWFKKKSVAMLQTWLNKCIYSPDPMAKVKASPQAATVMPCRPDTLQGARLLRRELEPIWPCWLLPKVKHWPFSEQWKGGDINQEKI